MYEAAIGFGVGNKILVEPRSVPWEVNPADKDTPKLLTVTHIEQRHDGHLLHQRHVEAFGHVLENFTHLVEGSCENGFLWQFWYVDGTSIVHCA